jgi:hypothetical protein
MNTQSFSSIKFLLSLILIFSGFGAVRAQESETKPTLAITLQMDSFDFIAKGFSVWSNVNFNQNRVYLAGGLNELPDFLNDQGDDFSEKRDYFIQLGYVRFLNKPNGLFIGGDIILQAMSITSDTTNEELDKTVIKVAPVIGYEWIPFKNVSNFSITPWMAERISVSAKDLDFSDGKTYKNRIDNFVMGLNFGYRFDL